MQSKGSVLLALLLTGVAVWAEQHVIFDAALTFNSGDGRLIRQYNAPLDWSKGKLYRRLDIKSKPTDYDMGLQLCVWSGGETCGPCDPSFTSPGVYYTASEPSTW